MKTLVKQTDHQGGWLARQSMEREVLRPVCRPHISFTPFQYPIPFKSACCRSIVTFITSDPCTAEPWLASPARRKEKVHARAKNGKKSSTVHRYPPAAFEHKLQLASPHRSFGLSVRTPITSSTPALGILGISWHVGSIMECTTPSC